MTRLALVQPLAEMVFPAARRTVSEMPSLGFALLGTQLRRAGTPVPCITYSNDATATAEQLRDVDIIVAGDMRYYAYFCNPVPLLVRLATALSEVEFAGRLVLTGRCVAYLEVAMLPHSESYRLELCPDMPSLSKALGLRSDIAESLGTGPMPAAGLADPDLVIDGLQRLASRPVNGVAGQVLVTEGCRYRCAFCEKASTRIQSLDLSVLRDHLRGLANHGADYVVVWDEVFGQTAGCADVARVFADIGVGYGCNTRADLIDERFATLLAETGCRAVLMGLELASHEADARRIVRVDRGKSPPLERLRRVVSLLRNRGISAIGSSVVGVPGDTPQRITARLEALRQLELEHLYVRPLVPFPGTELFRRAAAERALPPLDAWTAAAFPTYPWGYPLLPESPSRRDLAALAGWPS